MSLRNRSLEVKRCQTDGAIQRKKTHLWISYITSERGQYSFESPWLSPAEGKRRSEVASVAAAASAMTRMLGSMKSTWGKCFFYGLGHSRFVLHDQDHMLQYQMCTSVIKQMFPEGVHVFQPQSCCSATAPGQPGPFSFTLRNKVTFGTFQRDS